MFTEMEKQDPSSMKPGHCPKIPGDIPTRALDLNFTKLAGVWRVAYDEKELNDKYSCAGTRLDLSHSVASAQLSSMAPLLHP